MATSPRSTGAPTHPASTPVVSPTLAPWEQRLLSQARLLRQAGKGAKLMVEIDGLAMCIYLMQPAGRVLISE